MAAINTLPLDRILGWAPIMGLMEEISNGVPDPLPEAFRRNEKEVLGNAARLMTRPGTRRVARRVEYGAPARSREPFQIGYKDFVCASFLESIKIDPNVLLKLRDMLSYENQSHGRDELAAQIKYFSTLFANSRITMRQQALARGHLYFDEPGNLLPNSSGSFWDVNMNIPSGHTGQLGGIIDTSWVSTAADPNKQILALRKQSMRDTGLPIEYAFYTEQIPSYLISGAGTAYNAYFSRHQTFRDQIVDTGELPSMLFGIKNWIPVMSGFFEDSTGTNQDIWPASSITFTPDPAKGDWWKNIVGSILVPKSIDITAEGTATLDNTELKYGRYGYGQILNNGGAIGAVTYVGDNYLPAISNENCVYQAVVAF